MKDTVASHRGRVGRRLKEIRESRGLSQRQVAELLHIAHSAISKMEDGSQKVDADFLFRAAEVLRVKASDFLDPPYEEGEDLPTERVSHVVMRSLSHAWNRLDDADRVLLDRLVAERIREMENQEPNN